MNRNSMRTVFLMTLVAVLFMLVGQVLGGSTGLVIAFIFAMGMNELLVLGWKMYRAEEVNQQSHPKLFSMVRELTQKADLPMPKLYIIPQEQPNAFATGRNPENSAVAFTQGILNTLDMEQLRGVTAHELAHIKNRDILTQTIVTTVVSALSMLAQFAFFLPIGGDRDGPNPLVAILVLITAPIAASLLQAAISRTREYEADRTGAEIAGSPRGLASALQRIEQAVEQQPMRVSETAMRSTSHMFPVNPFKGGKFMSLFSTHPETEDRVNRLMHMAETGEYDFS